MLDSHNHILLEDEPAWEVFLTELDDFLGPADVFARPQPSPS